MNLIQICNLARSSSYNEAIKARFRSEAMKYLRALAKRLNLPKETYSVRYNAGGIAVSGEATLHHDKFYLQVSHDCYWRTCNGQRDYSGGRNRWVIPPQNAWFCDSSEEDLVEQIQAVLSSP